MGLPSDAIAVMLMRLYLQLRVVLSIFCLLPDPARAEAIAWRPKFPVEARPCHLVELRNEVVGGLRRHDCWNLGHESRSVIVEIVRPAFVDPDRVAPRDCAVLGAWG